MEQVGVLEHWFLFTFALLHGVSKWIKLGAKLLEYITGLDFERTEITHIEFTLRWYL